MKLIKRTIIFLAVIISLRAEVFGITDELIYKDTIENTYTALTDGKNIIENLKFNDIGPEHFAYESVIRDGALGLVKGYGNNFSPDKNVTHQEAITFVLRALGYEKEAMTRAENYTGSSNNLGELWAIGYLDIARELEIITEADFNDAILPNQVDLNQTANFVRGAQASREDIAYYIVRALNSEQETTIVDSKNVNNIYNFTDYENISVDRALYVENVVDNNIMNGDDTQKFNPLNAITRAEMAIVLRNMDSVYYNLKNYERKNGTVGGVIDEQTTTNQNHNLVRNFYIRTTTGLVDVIKLEIVVNSSPQAIKKDTVVLKDGNV